MTPNLRPTRRGYAVLAVGVGAFVAGAAFGPRALDAVVLPAAVALLAAGVQVWRTPEPSIERRLPPADVPGTTGVVEVTLDAPETYPATVRERLPPGVSGCGISENADTADAAATNATATDGDVQGAAVVEATVGGDPISYAVTPRRRGSHEIGPTAVVATDVLGLVTRTHEIDARDALVAFPPVRSLSTAVRADLRATSRSHSAAGRSEFDGLREYVRGDALRDVHWKSSAKRDELMIQEFTAEADPERVTVAAGTVTARPENETGEGPGVGGSTPRDAGRREPSREGTDTGEQTDPSAADVMAEAAASVCLSLVRDGTSVTLTTPSGSVDADPGRARELLDHLAVTAGGSVPTRSADVVIVAGSDSTTVRFDGREHAFETLVDGDDEADGAAAGSAKGTAGSSGSAGATAATVGSDSRTHADERGGRGADR